MNDLIFYILPILLYYLFCICLYMIFKVSKNKKILKKTNEINKKINKILYEIIDNSIDNESYVVSNKDINFIKEKLQNNNYQQHIINNLLKFEYREEVSKILNQTKILDEFIYNEKQKNKIKKAYYIYVIGEFKLKDKYNFLMNNCNNKSIYVQVNVLKALANLGDYDYYIEGLKRILNSNTLMHRKIIIESLVHFNKINPKLNHELIKELNSENVELDVIIINYYTSIKCGEVSSVMYQLLEDKNTDKEILIASIKYFLENDYKDVKDILIRLLNDENWEIRAISATAIRNYNGKDVINALKKSITDNVWYVRQNSARSLEFLIKDKDKILSIIDKTDRYAYDAILNVLSEKNKINERIVRNA